MTTNVQQIQETPVNPLNGFKATYVDFIKERQNRQQNNNLKVYNSIINNDMTTLNQLTNENEIASV